MDNLVLVLIGGGVGSACRYAVSAAAGRLGGAGFPWGTLAVNLLGCLLIGFVVGLADRALVSRPFRVLLVTGFLGGFTTFSTFALETVRLLEKGKAGAGIINLLLHNGLGLIAVGAGLGAYWLVRMGLRISG